MNVSSERSVSLWMATVPEWHAEPLAANERADVVVVGSGIAGLSIAYELCRQGQSVIVLDRGPLGRGMTARTSAHLASALDDFYHELIGMRGLDEAGHYFHSQVAALERVEEIQRSEKIDCDFQRLDAYLFAASSADISLLEKEIDACQKLGFSGVTWEVMPGSAEAPQHRCVRFPNQARFHPLKYLAGLIRCIQRDGGRLYAETPVVSVAEKGGETIVQTQHGNEVHARAAVIATNSPINDWIAIHTKQAPYRTYVIAGRARRGSVNDALYWDTLDPYHYVRLQPGDADDDWLIVGGEDHKTGQADDQSERILRLTEWAKRHFPTMRDPEYVWSGQVVEPVDYVAHVGRNPGNENVFVVTGDSGEGLSNGVAGSLILRDLILGRENAWASAYAPNRISIKAAGEYISENLTMAANLAKHITGGELSTLDDLKPGYGALIRRGTAKLAAYRDDDGELHLRSASCTHAGCVVHWNAFEKCWDCPCHGSHFSVDGEPLNAPAFKPLANAQE
ncbi:FAD-dependent oxidoreductase [Sinorhizobium numidicum]|uniref:FAD-dependent oxidoreductase n=1 Tax=Sinorhizobium numidicum TaxID=680248 RepID=A0ABY8D200_9HYPH|nr:FAD-dependent oxidoreductase [Sinorhizobium numidicum]WEX78256.1 FAD-dependent oxidoreductase [Sinorhizobium numidicum]WEX84915.1 FAD-dependent oxidoreductase [Sinorhizobium numidicum]